MDELFPFSMDVILPFGILVISLLAEVWFRDKDELEEERTSFVPLSPGEKQIP